MATGTTTGEENRPIHDPEGDGLAFWVKARSLYRPFGMRQAMTRVILILGTMIAGGATRLHAQEDSLPFHRGQWGALINLGGFIGSGGGFLRFRNANHAWVLDGSVSLQRSHNQTDTSGTFLASSTQSGGSVSLRLGSRSYHPVSRHVDRQFTFGITGQYGRANQYGSGGYGSEHSSSVGAGVFAELGAEWLVTSHLALGAACSASLGFQWSHVVSRPYDSRGNGISASAGGIQLRGAFYF